MTGLAKVVCLWACILAFPVTAQTSAAQTNQQSWELGIKRLFLSCAGERHGPIVILEAGNQRTSDDWNKVQPEVARFTQVCSYDRAGLGRSEPHMTAGATPQDADQIVNDLRMLLAKASLAPPYLMVGHSLGGLLIRRFDSQYPGTVQGMVFVDSVHEEGIWRALDIDPRAYQGTSLKPEDIRRSGYLPPREKLSWHADIPLIVLRHGKPVDFPGPLHDKSGEFEAAMIASAKDLASRSRYGELRVATESGHFIQLDQPELVITAIHDVWSAIVKHHE